MLLTLTADQAGHLSRLLADMQATCAQHARQLEQDQRAPNAVSVLWTHVSFITDIREKLETAL